ncbi:MAG: YybH family protein [Solimonas sp.]
MGRPPPGGALVRRRSAIAEQMAKEATGEFKIEISSLETGSQGDIGYNVGTFRVLGTHGATVDTGKFIEVWKRVDGEWKIHADAYNSDAPAAPPGGSEPAAGAEGAGP